MNQKHWQNIFYITVDANLMVENAVQCKTEYL